MDLPLTKGLRILERAELGACHPQGKDASRHDFGCTLLPLAGDLRSAPGSCPACQFLCSPAAPLLQPANDHSLDGHSESHAGELHSLCFASWNVCVPGGTQRSHQAQNKGSWCDSFFFIANTAVPMHQTFMRGWGSEMDCNGQLRTKAIDASPDLPTAPALLEKAQPRGGSHRRRAEEEQWGRLRGAENSGERR